MSKSPGLLKERRQLLVCVISEDGALTEKTVKKIQKQHVIMKMTIFGFSEHLLNRIAG